MTEFGFDMSKRATKENLLKFAYEINKISKQIGFKVSSRGWCYQLENAGVINKSEFNRVENLINKCRKTGILPIDFTAEEEGRKFSVVENPTQASPIQNMRQWIEASMQSEEYYTPDWWEGEEYYIQMVVEKIDLKTLFLPVCKEYHIPVATSKGWSSMLQRATYSRRFMRAEQKGLKCVLLYCGDFDADGLRISDFLRKNLNDLKNVVWDNGEHGYDPSNLIIKRFGLNFDFIEKHKLAWINNMITGSGKNLADPLHPNNKMEYVQDYIKRYGVRKCEANAIVPMPVIAKELVKGAIINLLGDGALDRFQDKMDKVKEVLDDFKEKTGLQKSLQYALDLIDAEDED